ncbi:MAG: hydrogenase 4 subunit F [Candidatus Omnitrophota bacterium]
MLIALILTIPALLALGSLISRSQRTFARVFAAGYLAVMIACGMLLKETALSHSVKTYYNFIYLDALSAFFIFVTSVVAFAVALYSIGYIERDVASGAISGRKAKAYYLLFNLFCLSMFLVPALDNLGMLWVAIEMTTLISAFLVGFYNTKKSVEAAWKYIMICSVGIILALLGTILFSYAMALSGASKSLNWSDMASAAGGMDKNIVKTAFIFILVGYGTKAGLAPMHTWLPDAHSQAVGPISALLSGVLLKTSIYAILRFGIIVTGAVGFRYFGDLMMLLGAVSLVISCGFILVQKDLKRLLAYSSIEHVGIISIGFGLGTSLGACGALFHIFNHAVAKSLIFFGAGNMVSAYGRHNMKEIRGVIATLPFTGMIVFAGVFALTGFPPFSIFFSEIMIIMAAFMKGAYPAAGLVLLALSVIFGAFIYYFGKMLFGNPYGDVARGAEGPSGKAAMIFLFALVCVAGLLLPFIIKDLAWIAQGLFQI